MQKVIILVLALLLNCTKVVEPVTFGEYFVTNSTSKVILLRAIDLRGQADIMLQVDSVSVGKKAHIYSFVEGSGGHVMPSNAFSGFIVYSESKTPANVIYSKIENSDWVDEGRNGQGHLIYNLTIK